MNKVYLDYNATAPIRPEVITGMSKAMQHAHNASSVHSFGREGRKLVEAARDQIAALTGCPAAQIIFNSGATEGNNTILHHFANTFPDEQILVSSIEHPSMLETTIKTTQIPCLPSGIIDLDALETLLKDKKTSLVSVMYVNNETGIIQPVKDAASLAHKHGALFHCDGVQAAGRKTINIPESGIDFLSLSAHKLGGPQGVGALCLGLCGQTPILLQGGGQEKSARAGTENVAGIHGFGIAADLALKNLETYQTSTTALQEKLETALSAYEHIKIYGQETERAGNTTLFALPGISSETLLMAFDLEGIALSNGSACSSGKVEPSHVLTAMQEPKTHTTSALRLSTGWATTQDDITAFLTAFDKIYDRVKSRASA